MITKHIGHVIMVSLKYFFDIDHSICYHVFTTVAMIFGIAKLVLAKITYVLQDGLMVVRDDLGSIKSQLAFNKDRWRLIK